MGTKRPVRCANDTKSQSGSVSGKSGSHPRPFTSIFSRLLFYFALCFCMCVCVGGLHTSYMWVDVLLFLGFLSEANENGKLHSHARKHSCDFFCAHCCSSTEQFSSSLTTCCIPADIKYGAQFLISIAFFIWGGANAPTQWKMF